MSPGDQIRAELKEQGRSQRWLATRTGYSYSYVTKVLSGENDLTEEFVDKAATALDVTLVQGEFYRGRRVKLPLNLFKKQVTNSLEADVVVDTLETAWKQSWVEEHGATTLATAAERAWQKAAR